VNANIGEVITFYSYKGGTGRSMALANVAVLLAQRHTTDGPVLMIDWDLEAPGLYHFFQPYLPHNLSEELGLIDLFGELDALTPAAPLPDDVSGDELARNTLAQVELERYIRSTTIPGLRLMTAGDVRAMAAYSARVNTFDWESLYHRSPAIFRALALELAGRYRYVLVDSRTGLTDISGICTMLLPEKLVVVFTPNQQSLTGVRDLVQRAIRDRLTRLRIEEDLRPLVVYPLPSRIDAERDTLRKLWRYGDPARNITGFQPLFQTLFEEVYGQSCDLDEYFNKVLVKHSPDYAYGETIAVEIDSDAQGDVFSLTQSYSSLLEWVGNSYLPWERLEDARASRKLASLEDTERELLATTDGDPNAWLTLETTQRQILELRRAGQDRSVGLVTALASLAATLEHKQDLTEAKALLQEALSICKAEPEFDTTIAKILRHLVRIARATKQFADAVAFQIRLVEVQERLLGPNHPDVTASRKSIAELSAAEGMRPINAAKLILAGRGGAGKTSLIRSLLHDRPGHSSEVTDGIAVRSWDLPLQDDVVRLNIWDFGGQELMHSTHQLFFTPGALYLLVLDARRDGDDAEYWLDLIELMGGDAPVIIALNKSGEGGADINRRALQQRYVNIREIIETDCITGLGIEQLRDAIEREVQRLPGVHEPFPSDWFAVKKRLSQARQHYLSLDEYRQVCAALHVTDGGEQRTLLEILHHLGSVVHFNDPDLFHTIVLNPGWLVRSVYAILNSPSLAERRGEIAFRVLSAILKVASYPEDVHPYLIGVMQKFELCMPLEQQGDPRFLFPDLLSFEAPAEANEFRPEECLNFVYEYATMPPSLIPRVIVRTHHMSGNHPRWREGVIISSGVNVALIESDRSRRRIRIAIQGSTDGRPELLAVLRQIFGSIHRTFTRLVVREMVPVPSHPGLVIEHAKLLALHRRGIPVIPEFSGDKIVELDVARLLTGIGSITPAKEERGAGVFLAYSHRDEALVDELRMHLKPLERTGAIRIHDRKVLPGQEWDAAIDAHVRDADVIVALVSADFLASDYCWGVEMNLALDAHHAGRSRLLPVILRACDWTGTPLGKLQASPTDGVPVASQADRDSTWQGVAQAIRLAAEKAARGGQP
jgi:internalin A